MPPSRTICQHILCDPGGSIDIDFYRARAIALRRDAMRDIPMVKSTCAGLLMVLSVLTVIVLATAPVTPTPSSSVAAAARPSHATE